jgi:hypothetical protein
VDPGHADVGQPHGGDPVGGEDGGALVGDGQVRRPGRRHDHGLVPGTGGPPRHGRPGPRGGAGDHAAGAAGEGGGDLVRRGAGEQDRALAGLRQELGDDGGAVLRGLARPVDRLGEALAQGAVMVDPGEAEVRVRQAAQGRDGVVRRDGAGPHAVEEGPQRVFVHRTPAWARPGRTRERPDNPPTEPAREDTTIDFVRTLDK